MLAQRYGTPPFCAAGEGTSARCGRHTRRGPDAKHRRNMPAVRTGKPYKLASPARAFRADGSSVAPGRSSLATGPRLAPVSGGAERLPAPARRDGVRVGDGETATHQRVGVAHASPPQQIRAERINDDPHAVLLDDGVVLAHLAVEGHAVAEPPAATRAHIYAKQQIGPLFLFQDAPQASARLGSQGHHGASPPPAPALLVAFQSSQARDARQRPREENRNLPPNRTS